MKKPALQDTLSIVFLILVTVLYVLTDGKNFSSFIYTLIALAVAIYFFPVKFLLYRETGSDMRGKYIFAITDPLLSYLIAASVAAIFGAEKIPAYTIMILAVGVVNVFLLFYHYFKGSKSYYVAIHAIAAFLVTIMMVG